VNGTIDWSPLFSIAEDAIIWVRRLALDAAAPPDRAAIERVCRAAFAVLDGRRGDGVQLTDQLTMLRVVGRALERDRGWPPGRADLFVAILGCALSEHAASIAQWHAASIDPDLMRCAWNAAVEAAAVPARASTPPLDALINQLLPVFAAQAHR